MVKINRANVWVTLIIVFFILFIFYGIFEAKRLVTGPKISISSPKSGSAFDEPLIEVNGKVKNISFLSLNDRQIFADSSGHFSEKLILLPGYNIITLKAKDRFGKEDREQLELILNKESLSPSIDTEDATSTNSVATSTVVSTTTKVKKN